MCNRCVDSLGSNVQCYSQGFIKVVEYVCFSMVVLFVAEDACGDSQDCVLCGDDSTAITVYPFDILVAQFGNCTRGGQLSGICYIY